MDKHVGEIRITEEALKYLFSDMSIPGVELVDEVRQEIIVELKEDTREGKIPKDEIEETLAFIAKIKEMSAAEFWEFIKKENGL